MGSKFLNRILSNIACFIAVFGSGLSCIYPVVSAYLRNHYNLTQSQVGVIAVTSQIGESLHLPSALTLDAFGPKWTMAVGLVISGSGWFWTWWSSKQPIYNQPEFTQLAIMFFITAFGRTYSYCSGFVTMLHNTPAKLRGKVTAFLDALFELAVLGIFLVYRWVVLSGNLHASAEEDSDFFLYTGVIIICLIIIPMPFIRFSKGNDDKMDINDDGLGIKDSLIKKGSADDVTSSKAAHGTIDTEYYQTKNSGPALRLIFSLEYQLILWGSALSIALAHFLLFNIASITLTLSITRAERYLLAVYKVSILLSRLLCGTLFDRFCGTRRSYYLLISVSILGALGQAFVLIPYRQGYVLVVTYFLAGSVEGAVYIAVPVFITEIYGLEHLGRNVSLIYTMKIVTTVGLQVTYDSIYESMSLEDGYCIGHQCIVPVFLGFTFLGIVATLCSSLFSWRILKTCSPKCQEN